MGYREIPGNRILRFRATPGFKGWKRFFTDASIAHPAKMNLFLLRWILKKYTSQGDRVLDPMAGTGSTGIIAAIMGRHSICVEYEPAFFEMIKNNIELARTQSTFTTPRGNMGCVLGDARKLSEMLNSDVVATSPPYSMSRTETGGEKGRRGDDPRRRVKKDYAEISEGNIGRRPHGNIDTVVLSPPYGNRLADGVVDDGDKARMSYMQAVDAVIISPPYGSTKAFHDIGFMKSIVHEQNIKAKKGETKAHYRTDEAELRYLTKIEKGKIEEPDNIGNLKHGDIDAIVTSQPYEAGPFDHAGGHGGSYAERDAKIMAMTQENIGILKGQTYLEAMLQVYRECWKTLKPGGKMILVVKNFIRGMAIIRLDLDTIKLCELAGFTLIDHWYFRIPHKSFWRILYHKNYPDVPEILYEDILILVKGTEGE